MAGTSFQHAAQARAALGLIVSEPDQGTAALSSAKAMVNLLKDFLPDAPRETAILVASIEHGVPDTLRERIGEGMDVATAIRLTASALADATVFTPEACDWAVCELAIALSLSTPEDAVPASATSPAAAVSPGGTTSPAAAASPGGTTSQCGTTSPAGPASPMTGFAAGTGPASPAGNQGGSNAQTPVLLPANLPDYHQAAPGAAPGELPAVVSGAPAGSGRPAGSPPARRRRAALVLTFVGVAVIAIGAAVIAILASGPGATKASSRSGIETIMLTSNSAEANPVFALTATGLFSGTGTLPGIGDGLTKSLARLPGGDFVLSHPQKDSSAASSVDPTTCVYTYEQTGKYTIGNGTGKFAGITGSGTYVNIYTATLPRKNGKCDTSRNVAPLPGTVSRTVNGSGPVTLP